MSRSVSPSGPANLTKDPHNQSKSHVRLLQLLLRLCTYSDVRALQPGD